MGKDDTRYDRISDCEDEDASAQYHRDVKQQLNLWRARFFVLLGLVCIGFLGASIPVIGIILRQPHSPETDGVVSPYCTYRTLMLTARW